MYIATYPGNDTTVLKQASGMRTALIDGLGHGNVVHGGVPVSLARTQPFYIAKWATLFFERLLR